MAFSEIQKAVFPTRCMSFLHTASKTIFLIRIPKESGRFRKIQKNPRIRFFLLEVCYNAFLYYLVFQKLRTQNSFPELWVVQHFRMVNRKPLT